MKRIRVRQLVTFEGDEEAVEIGLLEEGTQYFPGELTRTVETTSAHELLPYELKPTRRSTRLSE